MTASEPHPEVMALIQEAAAVEREAAALIADKVGDNWQRFGHPTNHTVAARVEVARAIAAQIRARNNPK